MSDTLDTDQTKSRPPTSDSPLPTVSPLVIAALVMNRHQEKLPPSARKLRLTEARQRLVQLYDAWGKTNEANKWRKTSDD